MGGSTTRRGRSPSQARSSRREVSRNLACVSRAARRKSASSACSAALQAGLAAGGEARHRLDVVPDPQHGDLPHDLQGQAAALRVVQRQPVDVVLLEQRLEDAADRVQARAAAAGSARTRSTAPGRRSRRWPGTSGRTRRRWRSCRCRRRRAAARRTGCRRRGPRPAGWRRGQRSPRRAAAARLRGSPAPGCPRSGAEVQPVRPARPAGTAQSGPAS